MLDGFTMLYKSRHILFLNISQTPGIPPVPPGAFKPSPGVPVPWPASRAGLRFRRGGQAEPRADPRRGFGLGGLEGLADAGEGGIDNQNTKRQREGWHPYIITYVYIYIFILFFIWNHMKSIYLYRYIYIICHIVYIYIYILYTSIECSLM